MITAQTSSTRATFEIVRELSKALRRFQGEAVFCENITFTQFTILDFVALQGRLKLSELHELLKVEKSTTTRLVQPLFAKGLLARQRSPGDLRAVDLILTPEGRETHGRVWQCLDGLIGRVLAEMTEAEAGVVVRALAAFARSISNCCNDAACCG